jgi:hypothetical protein
MLQGRLERVREAGAIFNLINSGVKGWVDGGDAAAERGLAYRQWLRRRVRHRQLLTRIPTVSSALVEGYSILGISLREESLRDVYSTSYYAELFLLLAARVRTLLGLTARKDIILPR